MCDQGCWPIEWLKKEISVSITASAAYNASVLQKAKDAAEARLLQDFLESTSNQLTYSGLEGLLKGLRPNELAVFFRNNHFNTVFLHNGSLHILVTDMGYLAHPVSTRCQHAPSGNLSGSYTAAAERFNAESASAQRGLPDVG